MPIVYQHRRLDTNEVFYVGIGNTINRAYSKRSRNKYWKHIIDKTDYIVEIVLEDITWEEACQKETELIKQYGRKDLNEGSLVNMTDGGDGSLNLIPTVETRNKMSISQKKVERKPLSEEVKNKKIRII